MILVFMASSFRICRVACRRSQIDCVYAIVSGSIANLLARVESPHRRPRVQLREHHICKEVEQYRCRRPRRRVQSHVSNKVD
jgi:hypothetical protein